MVRPVKRSVLAFWLTITTVTPIALGDGLSPTMVVFDRDSDSLGFSTWNGSAWSTVLGMPSIGSNGHFVVLRNCPTRNETACAIQDHDHRVHVLFHNGTAWTSPVQACSDVEQHRNRAVDLAYEQNSGDALIAYWNDDGEQIGYRTYNGTLSTEAGISLPYGDDEITYLALYSKPNSDEIILLAVQADDDDDPGVLLARVWNGSSWGSWATLETTLQTGSEECFALAYEGLSGDALVAYSEQGKNAPRYRVWNGSSWSAEAQAPSLTKPAHWIRLEADPASDAVLFGALDSDKRVSVNVWSGSAWSSRLEVVNGTNSYSRRGFDLAFEPGGVKALVVYDKAGQNRLHYRAWNGTAWSGETQGPDLGNRIRVVHLRTGSADREVFIAASDDDKHLELARWNGSSMSSPLQISSSLHGSDQYEHFMFSVPGASKLFTDVSVAMGFNVQSTSDYHRGSGLHWGDLDNDGDLDCIATGNSTARRYVNNNAGQSFTVSTFGTGDVRRQGALVDIDNDGDLDFWATCVGGYDTETCYQNNGAGVFTNIGNLGLSAPSNNAGVAAADVNHDGWCDIVMFGGVTNGHYIGHSNGASPVGLVQTNASSYGLNGYGDTGNGEYCASGDVNNDGYLDFFYDWNNGRLFVSKGDGTYAQNSRGISVVTGTGTTDKFGPAFGDYDNDGDLDLFVPREAAGNTGYLWRNDVNWAATPVSGTFTNVTASAGVTDTSGQRSACWGDYDNDGDLDLYIVTHSGASNVLYQNQGPPAWNFVAVNVGTAAPGNGHDAVFVDYDNDGDLDLAVTQQGAGNVLLRNNTNDERYLKVRVVGLGAGKTNKAAIGVRVELWNAAGTTRLARRDIGTARGYGGGEPLWAHFGGVTKTTTYTVKVYFDSRSVDEPYAVSVVPQSASTTIGDRTIPQMVTIEEPQGVKVVQWREKVNAPAAQ